VQPPTDELQLSDRGKHLFRVLVELYIRFGQPVGSRTLARESGLELSAATIRNVMADLEDAGLVTAPHTSAGRVPTALGYRFFVDRLLTVRPPPYRAVQRIRRVLDPDQGLQELLTAASGLLSGATQLAGLVMVPRKQTLTLRQVAFLPLSDRRVLAVLVLNEREVQNRVIHTDRDYSQQELEQAASFLNSEFAGQDVERIRAALVQDLQDARRDMDTLMRTAAEVGQRALEAGERSDDYVIAGEENLIGCDEFGGMERLRQLFDVFNRKRDIVVLLDQVMRAEGLRVLIGEESGHEVLDGCSLVTAPYAADAQSGVLAVIGPTRMAYEQVIPIVDTTARYLGAALKHH
jgi:heat-inducible transcriptional repressor